MSCCEMSYIREYRAWQSPKTMYIHLHLFLGSESCIPFVQHNQHTTLSGGLYLAVETNYISLPKASMGALSDLNYSCS